MKSRKIIVSLIATISLAMASYMGVRPFLHTENNYRPLLVDNIEALSEDDNGVNVDESKEKEKQCYESDGYWNMAGICVESGFQTATCTVSGEIVAFGITIKGSYSRGGTYMIPWARYECKSSSKNCCTKQGLFSGSTRLA